MSEIGKWNGYRLKRDLTTGKIIYKHTFSSTVEKINAFIKAG